MYKLNQNPDIVVRVADGLLIPMQLGNTDYQAYLEWVDAGNTPEPADAVDTLALVVAEAKQRLQDTDWSQVADVTAVLTNKSAFDAYRASVRSIYLNPTETPTWPERPVAVWA